MKKPFGEKGNVALAWPNPLPHMQEYLENMEAEERDPSYIRASRAALIHFSNFAEAEGVMHPDEITRAHVVRFQAYVNKLTSSRPQDDGRPLSEQYRQQILKYIRTWVTWLVDTKTVTTDPWVRIRIGRTKKVSRTMENEDMSMLFDTHLKHAFQITPFYYHRREVILVLLYGWGLRIHELAALTVSGMDVRQDFVIARNKRTSSGVMEKTLPYNVVMKETVGRWLKVRPQHADPTVDALLINREGRPMTTAMIYKVVVELGRHAGVAINPHRLRDTFGTTLLDEGVAIEQIMDMMGHSRREQTQAYARPSTRQMKLSHDATMGPALKGLLRQ